MGFKSWKFGKQAKKLPVIQNLAEWKSETLINFRVINEKTHARRFPSRSVPETLAAIVQNPGNFLVKSRKAWDIHKISRLYSGEIYPLPETQEITLQGCWVHIPSGMVISKDREVLAPTGHSLNSFYQGHSEVDWDDAPFIDEECFLLATVWGSNYAHWLMDSLPRLSGVTFGGERLLLGSAISNFQKKSLSLLGFHDDDIYLSEKNLVRCRQLRVHIAAPASGVPHPVCLADLRQRLQKTVSSAHSKNRRLYITRQSTRRKILNHQEIQPVLDEFGFETINPAEMDFKEQVHAFSDASAILGVHGAGTMNTLFAPSGSRLIEIYNPMVWDHAAHRVASLCNIDHFHCFAENANREYEIRVDPEILVRTLALAFDKTSDNPNPRLIEKTF